MKIIRSILLICVIACLGGATPSSADPVAIRPFPAPQLTGGPWVNGNPVTPQDLRGKVVVLLFWTHGCINCKHNLGYWNDWAKEYKGSDVAVISVHTPEGDWERQVQGVRDFVRERGLVFPVVIDNDHANWNSYGVQAWPCEILVDKAGVVRYEYDGELNWNGSGEYKTVQSRIEELRRD